MINEYFFLSKIKGILFFSRIPVRLRFSVLFGINNVRNFHYGRGARLLFMKDLFPVVFCFH